MDESRIRIAHWGWWVAVFGGMTLLTVLALSSEAHAAWERLAGRWYPQLAMQITLAIAIALHVGEALYAVRLARRHRLPARGWGLQTLALGYPSLRLLLAIVKQR